MSPLFYYTVHTAHTNNNISYYSSKDKSRPEFIEKLPMHNPLEIMCVGKTSI